MEIHQISAVVLMDLSTAFDTVNHTIPLEAFEKFCGITGEAPSWIKSFLSGRSFCVTVHTQLSEEKQLYLSLPQYSYRAPTVYLSY